MGALTPVGAPLLPALASLTPAAAASATALPDFGSLVMTGVNGLNSRLVGAEQALAAISLGGEVPVQEVMIAMEHARFSLQFAVELRNRLVEAYSEISRIQI